MSEHLCLSVVLTFFIFSTCVKVEPKKFVGPIGIDSPDMTTCEEFSKFARFNPYSVMKETWFIFFYWGSKMFDTCVFTIPTANDTKYLHNLLDNNVEIPVNWSARHVLMWDEHMSCSLLTERDDRGAYWLYTIPTHLFKDTSIPAVDIRLKQIGNNLYIGLMFCREKTAYAMSKLTFIPKKKYLQDAAAKIGFRGRRGLSYLYQGHQWFPIPEATEADYWKSHRKSLNPRNWN